MKRRFTPTELRGQLYAVLDQVLNTGVAVQVVRNGRVLTISSEEQVDPLSLIDVNPNLCNCDSEELVHIDWSEHWNPELP